ncbi:hypothetical protein EOM39_01300 [Candidatus Gracilibacteria bacterium]|nr:hypothetical protein [Candidatus Gracilibacteria bacterium]
MLVLNKGQRIIDGIQPNEKKDIKDEIAKKLSMMYKDEIIIVEVINLNTDLEKINKELSADNQRLKVENDSLKLEIEKLKEDTLNIETKTFNNSRKK